MRDLTNLSNEQLETFRRNALATDYGAIGHTKSHWNHVYYRRYTEELEKRGVELPSETGFELAKLGTYNGEGSF